MSNEVSVSVSRENETTSTSSVNKLESERERERDVKCEICTSIQYVENTLYRFIRSLSIPFLNLSVWLILYLALFVSIIWLCSFIINVGRIIYSCCCLLSCLLGLIHPPVSVRPMEITSKCIRPKALCGFETWKLCESSTHIWMYQFSNWYNQHVGGFVD